jgi:uncharacterized protein YciI
MMYFLALFRPGPAWLRDVPLDRQPFTVEHAAHLQRLYKERKVFMGGPCAGKSDLLSVVILEAASETEAFEYLKDNAFVTQRVVEVELHPWQVVFGPPS